jgi:trehalose synthase
MNHSLESYTGIVGQPVIQQLHLLAEKLRGLEVVHVNSTSEGGGVAEILAWMTPLMCDLGLDAKWKVIRGTPAFFSVTKHIHNGLQGRSVPLTKKDWDTFFDVNSGNISEMRGFLESADIVVIHDPQPAPLLELCPKRKGRWIWRAHIDISRPDRHVWKSLRPYVEKYDASIFSMCQYAQTLPHPQFIVAPSIDPLSDKNIDMDPAEIEKVRAKFGLDPDRPLLVQISRFDRFKDPVGVIEAYRLIRKCGRPPAMILTSTSFFSRRMRTGPSTPFSGWPTSSSRSRPGRASASPSRKVSGKASP